MTLTIEAIYENGVLKPVQPLPLKEHEQVRVTIHTASARNWVSETAGMIKWTGDPATLRHLAEDVEFDPQESA
jgi:predicted DNA-binding antitoxin AbrB/MazE fold protein